MASFALQSVSMCRQSIRLSVLKYPRGLLKFLNRFSHQLFQVLIQFLLGVELTKL